MAEEKKNAVKADSKGSKFINWCKALPTKIATPFKNMAHELKRVTWPTKRKLIVYSVSVIVFVVAMAALTGLLDLGATALVRLLVPKG